MKKHKIVVFTLLAMVAFCTQTASAQQQLSPKPQAVSLYNLGLTAFKQGSPESAVIFFKRACDLDPNLADAQYNLGVIFQMQKRYREAIPRFEEVLRVKPQDLDAHYQLGIILQETSKYDEAITHLACIPPNSSHFADCQARISKLRQYLANQGGNTVDNSMQLRDQQGTAAAAAATTSYSQTSSTTSTPSISQSSSNSSTSNTSVAQQQSIYGQTSNFNTGDNSSAQASTTSSPVATTNSTPTPVAANISLRVIATGFAAPAGLSFDRQGNLYVANYMTNTVDRISTDGLKSQFSSGTNLKGPIGLAVDEIGNVYVANYNGGSIAKINPAGVATIIATGFRKPYYLTLDKEGNLYVSQQEDNSIVRISLPPRPIGSRP